MEDALTILLLEDNDDDAFITQRALSTAGVTANVRRCEDGQALIDYLSGTAPYEDREKNPLPHLVLLDLKVPRVSGLEVLEWIRTHDKFQSLVVLALTSSSERKDVEKALKLNVNAYLVKPTSLNAMTELARCVRQLWLDHAHILRLNLIITIFVPTLLLNISI